MDQVHVIRHKVLVEGQSLRRVAREMGFSRNTVRKYLKHSEPVLQEGGSRRRRVLEGVAVRIDRLLEEWNPRRTPKQRVTGTRIHRQLVKEGYQVGLTTVRNYLWEKRRKKAEVFVPLVRYPGDGAKVDFFEVTVEVGGERRKVWKFVMRLMVSGRDFVRWYEQADQLAFLEAHFRAFEQFQGVPARCIYDNLSAAVREAVRAEMTRTLNLPALGREYPVPARQAREEQGEYEDFLQDLLEVELESQRQGTIRRRLKEARFPDHKTLEQIDWALLKGVSRPQLLELALGQYLERSEDVVLAGPIGTGKAHLAIALGIEGVKRRFRVAVYRAADLVRELLEARDDCRLGRLCHRLQKADRRRTAVCPL